MNAIKILIIALIVPIIAIKKKTYKIPIIILNWSAFLVIILTSQLEREVSRDSIVLLFTIAGIMWLGSFVWCFITPKNKE